MHRTVCSLFLAYFLLFYRGLLYVMTGGCPTGKRKTHTCTHMCTHTHTYTHTCTHTHIHTHIHTHTRTHTHTRACAHTHTLAYTCILSSPCRHKFLCSHRATCNTSNESICNLTVNQFIGVYGGLTGAVILFSCARTLVFVLLILRSSRLLHDKMFAAILRSPVLFFDTNPVGRVAAVL